jgi:putative ABC transport system substrate-binding protein
MMRRREFIAVIGTASATWPLAAGAQHSTVRRVGVLMYYAEDDAEGAARFAALRDRLGTLGWANGRNAQIEARWAAGRPDLTLAYASQLVSQPADVIVAASTPVVTILKKLTDTIPIVFTQVADPVGSGFVSNYAKPDGNITGFADFDPSVAGKWLEVLKEAAPRIDHVTVFSDPDQINHERFLRTIQAAAPPLKAQIAVVTARSRAEIEQVIANVARQADGGVIVLPGPLYNIQRASIIEAAARYRVPAVYPIKYYVEEGGLLYYGMNQIDEWPQAADYVDRILRGEKPASLPVQGPTKYELVINHKTAKGLGLELPPMMLGRADEVIE